jgi:alkylhydroperoxidase family enzyme
MTRVKNLVDGPTELDQVWGLRGDYYRLFMADYRKSLSNLDPLIVELCRVRLAQMVESAFDVSLRYSPAVQAGLSEEKVAALSDYPTSALFTDRERIALEFTEQWVIQSSSITDEDVERLLTVLTPEEFIYFCKALSVMDQFARANAIFAIEPTDAIPQTMPDFALVQTAAV